MEEVKKSKGFIWLIIISIVLVLGLVGYIVYDKLLKVDKVIPNYDETTTTTTTKKYIELTEDELMKASINQLREAGYEKKDLTKIIQLDTYDLTYKLKNDYEGLLEENHHFGEHINQTISLENKVLNYSFSNKLNNYTYNITIENVSEIKYEYGGDNWFYRNIFVITETGEVWYLLTDSDNWRPIGGDINSIDNPRFIEKKGEYIDVIPLKSWDVADDYLLKTKDNKYILLSSNQEFDINTVYYENDKNGNYMFITKDNSVYYNGNKTDIKVKTIFVAGTDPIFYYYISQDNYLYAFSKPTDKYYNSKIKDIYSKYGNNVIIFEDDTRTVIKDLELS